MPKAEAAAGGYAPKCLMLKKEDEEAFQLMYSQCPTFAHGGSREGTTQESRLRQDFRDSRRLLSGISRATTDLTAVLGFVLAITCNLTL